MRIVSFCAVAALLLASTTDAFIEDDLEEIFQGNVLPFHPISMRQYRTLMDISGGRPLISEARLIGSGMTAIKGIALGIKQGVLSGLTLTGLSDIFGEKDTKGTTTGYPLCVISTQSQARSASSYGSESEEGTTDDDNGTYEYYPQYTNRPKPTVSSGSDSGPVVNCVVVVKRKRKTGSTTTARPTRPTKRPSRPTHIHYYPKPPAPIYTTTTSEGDGYGGYWPPKPSYPSHKPGYGGTTTTEPSTQKPNYGQGHKPGQGGTITLEPSTVRPSYGGGSSHQPGNGGTMEPEQPGYGGGWGKPKRKFVKRVYKTKHRIVNYEDDE